MDPTWEPYGMLKLDVASNTDRSNPASNNFIYNVNQSTNDGGVSMTARNSRFGARADMGSMKGRVEVDFYNADVLMRHVYLTMDLGGDMELLVGQTDDVISPLSPSMLNWVVGWRAGNIGHRSPQVRWSWTPEGGPIDVKVAFSDPANTNIEQADLQARVGFVLGEAMSIGANVLAGKSDHDADQDEEKVSAIAADFKAQLGPMLALTAEWFAGTNLSTYQGSIGLTPGLSTVDEDLNSTGLWVQIAIKISDIMCVHAGTMFEVIDDDDLAAAPATPIQKNGCVFGNVLFRLNDKTEAGVEISKWNTEYENDTDKYDNLRVQGSLIMKF